MEEIENLPLHIIGTVIVFIIVIYGLYRWLGTPECDSLANQTAHDLKLKIEEVSKEDFPAWHGSEPPGPQDLGYVKTSPIRLCQDHGSYSYWLQYFGGFPEYQIYFEEFPAASLTWATSGFSDPYGTMMWTEDYPYGGQQSQLITWAFMRAGSVGYKYFKWAKRAKTWNPISMINKIRNYYNNYNAALKVGISLGSRFSEELLDPKWSENGMQKFLKEGRNVDILAKITKNVDTNNMLTSFKDGGLLKKGADGDLLLHLVPDPGDPTKKIAKIIISDVETEVEVSIKEMTIDASGRQVWNTVQKKVYVVYRIPGDTASEITFATIDAAEAAAKNAVPFKVNPTTALKSYIDELATVDADSAKYFKSIYSFSDEVTDYSNPNIVAKYTDFLDPATHLYDGAFGSAPIDRFSKISWSRYVDEPYLDRLKVYFKQIKSLGYDTTKTVMVPEETSAFSSALAVKLVSEGEDSLFYKELMHKYIKTDTRLADFVSKKIGVVSSDAIAAKNIAKFTELMAENDAGLMIIPNKFDWRVTRAVANTVKLNSGLAQQAVDLNWGNIWKPFIIKEIGAENFDELVERYGENHIKNLIDDVLINAPQGATGPIKNVFEFDKAVSLAYLNRLGNDLKNSATKQRAIDQVGLLVGTVTQNTDPMPKSIGANWVSQVLYTKPQKFFTPSNWLYKGIIAADMRGKETCGGNSICIFGKGKAEVPYYLNRSSNHMIRLWRPVNPAITIGVSPGLRAAMMHVPSHPRFYVNSPCYAVAKIWKTEDNTIFILPEKVDMQGKSSNYCYADEGLINQYYGIWVAADTLELATSILTGGTKTFFKTLVKEADPGNILQMTAEMAIAWPGWPYASLTYDDMQSESGRAAYNELLDEIRGWKTIEEG